jgi:hypothetical protein
MVSVLRFVVVVVVWKNATRVRSLPTAHLTP